MGRWEPDAAGRLAKAAMELYVERGFDETTVAEIAKRAGLTERTFFRHFADKREVLFAGAAHAAGAPGRGVHDAPARPGTRRRGDGRGRGRGRPHSGTPGLRPPALRDHCGRTRSSRSVSSSSWHRCRWLWPTRCEGAAWPTPPPAWRPKWRSPSSGSGSNAGWPTPSTSTCPSSCVRHSTSSEQVTADNEAGSASRRDVVTRYSREGDGAASGDEQHPAERLSALDVGVRPGGIGRAGTTGR